MEELKPCMCCPVSALVAHKYDGETIITCTNCGVRADEVVWNTRPIEDALRTENAALHRLVKAVEALQLAKHDVLTNVLLLYPVKQSISISKLCRPQIDAVESAYAALEDVCRK